MAAKILVVDDEPDFQDLIAQKFTARIRAEEMQFVFASNALAPKSLRGVQWVPGEAAFTYLKAGDVYKHEAAGGRETLVLAGKSLTLKPGGEPIAIDGYEWSSDRKHLLIASQLRQIWRHHRE